MCALWEMCSKCGGEKKKYHNHKWLLLWGKCHPSDGPHHRPESRTQAGPWTVFSIVSTQMMFSQWRTFSTRPPWPLRALSQIFGWFKAWGRLLVLALHVLWCNRGCDWWEEINLDVWREKNWAHALLSYCEMWPLCRENLGGWGAPLLNLCCPLGLINLILALGLWELYFLDWGGLGQPADSAFVIRWAQACFIYTFFIFRGFCALNTTTRRKYASAKMRCLLLSWHVSVINVIFSKERTHY